MDKLVAEGITVEFESGRILCGKQIGQCQTGDQKGLCLGPTDSVIFPAADQMKQAEEKE